MDYVLYGSYNDETIKILREKSCSMSFGTKFSKTNLKNQTGSLSKD